MQSIIAYLKWISSSIPKRESYPWLGVREIRSHHSLNAKNGERVYEMQCASCHGKNGEGQQIPYELSCPPIWGDSSFNDAAGMNKVITLASFIYENMPYKDPQLNVEEALDVAAFVLSHKRPKFISHE